MTQQQFSYKPNPVFGPLDVVISETGLTTGGKGRASQTIAFKDLTRVRYWKIVNRGIVNQGIALEAPGQPTLRLEFGDNGMRGDGRHGTAFCRAVATTLRAIAHQRPDIRVTIGTSLAVSLAMSAMGLLLALVAFALGLVFLVEEGWGSGLIAGVSLWMVGGLGAMMAWSFHPWRQPEMIDPGLLANYFDSGPAAPQP